MEGQDGRRSQKGKRMARGRGAGEELNPVFTLKSHFLQSQIIVFIKVKEKKKEEGKKAEAAHWADWALVVFIVPNGY